MAGVLTTFKSRKLSERRQALRDSLWPDSEGLIWSRLKTPGFAPIPRIMPLVMALQKQLSTKGDPSSVYLDLWCRVFDEGFVTITDESAFAFSAGYIGPRAMRTWREHVHTLRSLGFVRTIEQGNRDIAHILLIDPYRASAALYLQGRTSKEWWTAFLSRATEIGVDLNSIQLLGETASRSQEATSAPQS